MANWDRRELNKLIAESPEEYKKRFPEPFSAMIPEDASSENKLATEAYVNEHGGGEAVKYTEQTLTAEQKAQALANIGAASEGEVSALADQKYEGPYATDGDLPAASASTMSAIYLVGPDANDEYDRKVTKLSGGTYSWASLGKTAIDLANYATKAEVDELEAKVDNLIVGPKQIDGTAQNIDVDVPLSFIDGSFKTASSQDHTISVTSNSGQSTIVIDNVSPGDVYLLKSEYGNLVPSFIGTYFIFAVDDTTSALTSTEAASFVELVDAVNYIYKITVPNGGTKKIFSAVHISYQENVWCKKITQSKSLEWLAVKKSNLDEEVKAALDNVLNIPASNINGNEQIVSQEDMTITFTDGTFKTLPAQTRYFADNTSSGNSLVQIAVQPGDVYYYKYYQAIQQSTWNTYFLFGQTLQMSPIFKEDIPDFVELIDATNFIYKVTIPEGANYFISAVSVSYKSQIWIKKIVTKKELAWLKLSADQIAQVTKKDKDNDALWKLWDSIRKPIDFNGRSMVAFGDSITYGIASPGLITTQQSYIKLFAQYAGISGLVVRAVSGSTLAQRGGGSDIYDRVISYTDPADIVWIAGGTNDWSTGRPLGTFGDSDPSTVYGALKGICEYLQTNYPNARVIFVTPIPYTLLESNWPNHITELNLYREAIYEVATYYGYDVVSGLDLGMPRTSGGWNNTMCADTDGCHPTERGHALYARSLAGKLL